LLGHIFIVDGVSDDINLRKISKFDPRYKKLIHIRIFLDYLNIFCKNILAMIKQLGPPTFFVTLTTCINNWLAFIKTLLKKMMNILIEI
jgi:hypothetical protein